MNDFKDIVIKNASEEVINNLRGMGFIVTDLPEPVEIVKEVEKPLPDFVNKLLDIINAEINKAVEATDKKNEVYKVGYEALEKLFNELNKTTEVTESAEVTE